MICNNCGKNTPFNGKVCNWCGSEKTSKERSDYVLVVLIVFILFLWWIF